MKKVTDISKEAASYVQFNIALKKAWDILQGELSDNAKWQLKIYYESAKKHIELYPDEAAKTIAIGLSRKTKYIEKQLKEAV